MLASGIEKEISLVIAAHREMEAGARGSLIVVGPQAQISKGLTDLTAENAAETAVITISGNEIYHLLG